MAGKKRVLRLSSQEPFAVPQNQLVLCSPQVGEPRITLSTALSIAGPENPACTGLCACRALADPEAQL